MDQFKGIRIKKENVEKELDNHQLLHYEFTDVEKTLETIHGKAFSEYRKKWNAATDLKEIPQAPLYIIVETNSYCNMKCKMCTRNYFNYGEKVDISSEVVDRIVQQCQEYHIPSILVGAGAESLINPNIKEILQKVKSIDNLDRFLITNGYNLDEEMANFLIDLQYERVYISLDAAREETYKKIRGCDLKHVEANLNRLLELREKRNSVLPLIRVSYVMQDENKDEIDEFFEKWKDKVDIIDYQCLLDYKDLDKLKEVEELPDVDFQCVNPFRTLLISYEGVIYPCASDYCYHMPVGNIMDMTIEEAWNSKLMTELRESMLNKSLGKICKNCVVHNNIQ